MCDAFLKKTRIFNTATAAKVFGVAEADVTKEMPYKSEELNFGII